MAPSTRLLDLVDLPGFQPRTQDLSLGKTLAAAGHVPHQKFNARGVWGKYQITSTCFQWDIR
jgi:hypothetical protein